MFIQTDLIVEICSVLPQAHKIILKRSKRSNHGRRFKPRSGVIMLISLRYHDSLSFLQKSRQTLGRNLYLVTLWYPNYCIIITCIVQILRIQPGPKLRDHVMVGIKRYSPMSYWRHRCIDSK